MPQFVKGVSGNPGGRPKTIRAVQELARKQTKAAIGTLVECLDATRLYGAEATEHPDYRVRVAAAVALLDRAYGKPSMVDGVQPTDAQKAKILALQAQKLEAEIKVLEKNAKDSGDNETPLIPGSPEYDKMLLKEWGYARAGAGLTKKDDADGADAAGTAPDGRQLAQN